jgi:uncharacterized protein (DUF362 family)
MGYKISTGESVDMKRLRQWVFWGLLILLGSVMLIQGLTSKSVQAEIKKLPDSKVAIVQSKQSEAADIQYEEIRAMIREAVSLAGGFPELVKDNSTVVIKPNLVQSYDNTLPGWRGRPLSTEVNGVTTDWRVTKAVVDLVREYNPHGKVYVMEGSGCPTKPVMNALNYIPKYIPGVDAFLAIEDDSGSWHDAKSKGLVKVKLPNGLIHKEYYLNKKYKEADVVISLPTLKNHWHAAVTGGIKNVGIGATPANIYGASSSNPIRLNMFNHESGEIHKWLHDFYLCRPVDYVIMDGLQGIQNGPTPSYETSKTTNIKQDQMNMRLILAGKDPIAVDTIESLVIGWDPQSVGYLRNLNNSGAGNLDTACIQVIGKRVDQVRKYFAGVIPPGGGAKINDKTAPELKVKQASLQSGDLQLSIDANKETVKVELFLDGQRLEPVITERFDSISVKTGTLADGKHQLKIYAYDRFLNCSEQGLEVTAAASTDATPVSDGNYTAPLAAAPPVIDGLGNDSCWENAGWRDIKYLWLGIQPSPEDFSGRYKIVWTPERLYFLIEITDDVLSDVYPDPLTDYYKDDCLEIFLDENHSGGIHTTNYNAFAYHIALDYNVVDVGKDGIPRLFNDHISIQRTKNGNVYTWEAAVKVFDDKYNEKSDTNQPVILFAGKKLGFAIAYCDNDNSDDRQSFIGSIDIPGTNKNVAYINASVFGTLTLEK